MKRHLWIGAAFAGLVASSPARAAGGDVTVTVNTDTRNLVVTGDASDNDIEITPNGAAGAFLVTGRNGTTVNGQASFAATDVRGFLIAMGDGADTLALTDTRLLGQLRIRLEGGDDSTVLGNVRVNRRATITGGSGNDRITVQDASIFRRFAVVRGDAGDDVVLFRARTDFKAGFRLDAGEGNDFVDIDDVDFRDDVRIVTQGGDDELRLHEADFEDDVDVNMGDDDDHTTVDDSDFNESVHLSGGEGHDDLSLRSGNDFDRIPHFRNYEH